MGERRAGGDAASVYEWRFGTGAAGDFEELVRRLTPDHLPATVGIRPMDVSNPGAALPSAATGPLGLEGALSAPTMVRTPWAEQERAPFEEALGAFLNRPTELLANGEGTRAVAAPLYGRWHAAQDRLVPGQVPLWFQQVNVDPRWRVAAGLGAQVVQAHQRSLMASAWQQAGGLAEVNDTLRGAARRQSGRDALRDDAGCVGGRGRRERECPGR